VLKVDRDDEKISLGMKQIEEDPWLALPEKYPISTRVQGKVRNLTSFGAFVEIEPGIDGLIHISDMSWTKRVQHPSEVLRKGDDVEVVVLGVDPENKRISLGLKQTTEDPWEDIARRFSPGVESDGRVVRLLDDGVVVDLGDDIEGFVPKSQVPTGDRKDLHEVLAEGQSMGLRVLECDAANRRIVLAVTLMPERPTPSTRPPAPAEGVESAEEPPAGEEAVASLAEAMAAPATAEGSESQVPAGDTEAESDVERATEEDSSRKASPEVQPQE
jgi:small subunit ribosomal protein S1